MKKVSDQKQRLSVLDAERSFIVQAPAGSGKTELLIQRYLRMLALVDEPEEIIAITFTRKAASEMRNRILLAFDELEAGIEGQSDAARLTQELVREVLKRDQQKNWNLLDNPARLWIQTIDALTASLTRQMPLLSGLGAPPETLDDASELYRIAASSTLAELDANSSWSEAITILLRHLDNDLPRVRDMLASMLARRDQWMRHIIEEHPRESLENAIAHQVSTVLLATRHLLSDEDASEMLPLISYAARNLTESAEDSLLNGCTDITALPGTQAAALESWQGISNLLLTKEGNWRKVANVKTGFPAAGKGPESENRAAMKDRFAQLLSRLSGQDELLARMLEIRLLPPLRYSDSEWQVLEALYQLLKLADAQLRLLFAEHNQMDFCGITLAAIQSLGTEEAPTDLAMQLDYRIRHILVDEFQDISINQYVLLERLTAGWSHEDGHSLFLVGDPMQSIYRFREAEVSLFTNSWDQQRLGQVALTPVNINVNFRSSAALVEWVNRVFREVLPEQADNASGAVSFVEASAYHDGDGDDDFHLHTLAGRDDGREAQQVCAIVQQAMARDDSQSIAVLVRNRSHLSQIIPSLAAAGIPYQAVEIETMGQRAAVQDLLSLTLALNHFADRIAWLSILRAPWCGLVLADLEILAGNDDRLVWDCMQDTAITARMSTDGQLRLDQLVAVLTDAFASRARKPLHRWVESVWLRLGGPACVKELSDLANSRIFFQLLEEFDNGGDLGKREIFYDKVESLFARPASIDEKGVQLMTIHKSKGLEFDTVILPGLSRGSAKDQSRLLMWQETPHAEHQDLLLAPVKEAGQLVSPAYNYLRYLEKRKQYYELGRLLYVATTRARKHLHLLATIESSGDETQARPRNPVKDSLLAQLWPALQDELAEGLQQAGIQSQAHTQPSIQNAGNLQRLTQGWQRPVPQKSLPQAGGDNEAVETSIEFEWAGESIKHTGTVVHRAIQWLAGQQLSEINAATIRNMQGLFRRQLQALGVPEGELEATAAQVELALQNMLDDERARWIFSEEHKNEKNEYAISGLFRGKVINVVLDRTFTDNDGVCWVVDYKTSRHEGGDIDSFLDQQRIRYSNQLEKYGYLMQALENRPVRLGLYFPLLKGWREWPLEVEDNNAE